VVIRAPSIPGGWAFRGSVHGAVNAYQQALQRVPTSYLAFGGLGLERLTRLLSTQTNTIRGGVALPPDTNRFGAFLSLHHDTLAQFPLPLADVLAGRPGTNPTTVAEAAARNRRVLRQVTGIWARAFPSSADALGSYALALEMNGAVRQGGGDSSRSALTTIGAARRAARTSDQRIRLAIAEVRMRVKVSDFAGARSLADSLLRESRDASPTHARELAGLAALTGRIGRTIALLQRAPQDLVLDGERVELVAPLADTAGALLARASFGLSDSKTISLARRTGRLIDIWAEPRQRTAARAALIGVPASLAFPALGSAGLPEVSGVSDNLVVMQRAAVRHDTAAVIRAFAELQRYRLPDRSLGGVSIDGAFHEARALLMIGAREKAIAHLDASLESLETLGTLRLDQIPSATAIVRAMALRAELAAERGDRVRAKKWADATIALWSNADNDLRPIVERMREIVG